MKANRKKTLTLVAASTVAIFSLAAVCGGAYAWFALTMQTTVTASQFAVVNNGVCDLAKIELYKFNYHEETYGTGENEFIAIDYLNPETGAVGHYNYNEEEGSFGYEESSNWVEVGAMNTYDPVELKLFASHLIDLHCNAVYKFTLSSPDLTNVSFSATVNKLTDKIKQADEIFLTSCVNFDIFYEADLLDTNPSFVGTDDPSTPEDESVKPYYPSYIDKSTPLSADEDVYYKLSYLASLKSTHEHFYGGSSTELSLDSEKALSLTYDSTTHKNYLTVYVNVDYAPSQLEYAQDLIYLGDIKAVYDFMFYFDLTERQGS